MKEGQVINSLMELPQFEPEERFVHLPRLNVVFQLRELTYNQLINLVQDPDREIQLILKATVNHPELKDFNWYHDKMGCATPVDALKKLLRKGEVERVCRVIDLLHGYAVGSVVAVNEDDLQKLAISKAVEELEKN